MKETILDICSRPACNDSNILARVTVTVLCIICIVCQLHACLEHVQPPSI